VVSTSGIPYGVLTRSGREEGCGERRGASAPAQKMHTTGTPTRQLRARAAQHSWGGGWYIRTKVFVGVGAPLLRLLTFGRIIRQLIYDSCSGCACRMWAAVLVAVLEVNSQRLHEYTQAHREAVESKTTKPHYWDLVNPGCSGAGQSVVVRIKSTTHNHTLTHAHPLRHARVRGGRNKYIVL
jgi:hypothetical protein